MHSFRWNFFSSSTQFENLPESWLLWQTTQKKKTISLQILFCSTKFFFVDFALSSSNFSGTRTKAGNKNDRQTKKIDAIDGKREHEFRWFSIVSNRNHIWFPFNSKYCYFHSIYLSLSVSMGGRTGDDVNYHNRSIKFHWFEVGFKLLAYTNYHGILRSFVLWQRFLSLFYRAFCYGKVKRIKKRFKVVDCVWIVINLVKCRNEPDAMLIYTW